MRTKLKLTLKNGALKLRPLVGAMRTCPLERLQVCHTVATPRRGDEDPTVKAQVNGLVTVRFERWFAVNLRLRRKPARSAANSMIDNVVLVREYRWERAGRCPIPGVPESFLAGT